MPIEGATNISQLNTAWPLQADLVREGAAHLRQEKTVLKTTFPNVAGVISASHLELSYISGLTSAIQPQINSKGAIAGQTWTGPHVFSGTATLPAATTIGSVTATELGYLSGVTSSIQTQLSAKANKAGDTYTGTHNYSGATAIKVPTMAPGTNTTDAASTAFVIAQGLSGSLPGQAGNAGKYIKTNGTDASWQPAVASLNGESGDLVKTTLAGYGIADFKLLDAGTTDLNDLVTAGQYSVASTAANLPPGAGAVVVTVTRVGTLGSQSLIGVVSGMSITRGFQVVGGTKTFSPWRKQTSENPPWVDLGSGTVIDTSLGTNFKATVSANRTFTLTAAQETDHTGRSCFVELTLLGGAVNFVFTIYRNGGAAPNLAVNKRHLFFFQLASNENAWIASYLEGFQL